MDANARVLGEWMAATWDWEVFATLTFRDPPPTHENAARGYTKVGTRGAERALLSWLHEAVVPRAPGAFWWFVEEPHRYRTTPHFHGLLGGVQGLRRDEVWKAWYGPWGIARIEPVEFTSGAAVYCAKYVTKGWGRMWTSRSLQASARKASGALWPGIGSDAS